MGLSNRQLLGYVVSISVLAVLIVSLLGTMFYTRVPRSAEELAAYSLLEDGVAVSLVLGAVAVTVLLVGLIVVVGARYGLADPDELDTE